MFEDLIRFRLDYVINLIKQNDAEISRVLGQDIRLGAKRQLLQMFFEIVRNSLRSERRKGREILRFMDDVSGRDMRTALGFFRTFLQSGNTDVEEMLKIEDDVATGGDHFEIPVHHVIKSIILSIQHYIQ